MKIIAKLLFTMAHVVGFLSIIPEFFGNWIIRDKYYAINMAKFVFDDVCDGIITVWKED
jgi:hypothetical protein